MIEKKNMKIKMSKANAKSAILDKACDLINEVGAPSFRVDMLSKTLGNRYGNIIYHFRKKEDLTEALWDEAIDNIKNTYLHYVSSILDVKQLYVFLRALANENMKYIGVLAYKLSDMSKDHKSGQGMVSCGSFIYSEYLMIIEHLIDNGCLNKKEFDKYAYLTFSTQLTLFCWWLGNEFRGIDDDNFVDIADRFAIAVIYPLTPFMTEEGLCQFNKINKLNK